MLVFLPDHFGGIIQRYSSGPPFAIAISRTAGGVIHRQLYTWFQRAIANGTLRPGQSVPSSRALAAELAISRAPVLCAYEQLMAEGYLEPVRGAGTRVVRSIPGDDARQLGDARSQPDRREGGSGKRGPRRVASFARQARGDEVQPWLRLRGAFRMHSAALAEFPVGVWSQLLARHARHATPSSLDYGDSMGMPALREALAAYLGVARAVRCRGAQVIVTSGSQQALALAARALLEPGDHIWMEEPGYPGAHQAFRAAGLRMAPVPVDGEGLVVEEGRHRCPQARAVYLTPSHQYPLGMVMSATRRLQLLQWASRTGAWVLEDDYDSEFRYGTTPIAALQGLDADQRVIYIGTFSKVLFPSLRIGYMVLPPDLAARFAAVRDAADICPAFLHQAVAADFLREGHFGHHVRRMRLHYQGLRDCLDHELARQLPGRLEPVGARAGMHLAVLLPPGTSDRAISATALARGLSLLPLSFCRLRPGARPGLVLGYGSLSAGQIRDGVRELAACL
ncbi:MAG: PLP-dependent aminotransferase family protein [Terriglobales bacterium]